MDLSGRLIEAGFTERTVLEAERPSPRKEPECRLSFISPLPFAPKVSPALDLGRVPCYMTEP